MGGHMVAHGLALHGQSAVLPVSLSLRRLTLRTLHYDYHCHGEGHHDQQLAKTKERRVASMAKMRERLAADV